MISHSIANTVMVHKHPALHRCKKRQRVNRDSKSNKLRVVTGDLQAPWDQDVTEKTNILRYLYSHDIQSH